jgi:GNAT superfamily N-acetyltransferase
MRELEIIDGRIDQGAGEALVQELLAELTVIYNERGPSPPHPEELLPPHGAFLIGVVEGEVIGCVGFRRVDPLTAELKRMFVRPGHRGQGYSRTLLAAIEARARAQGYRRMLLETGDRQHPALALYRSSGYQGIPLYSPYEDHPNSRCFSKEL